ncbi:unnamed protein product [Cyprideis torosa]|uniref:Uncharacterized protein n=1 Tax=Cyprideis torosa TaxID=163714 RepID=A0A7R8ZS40_9CRUS|nr:unnamed protein product [Cyprideis torosa]CAG0894629.1 unnamed protein product [Cyprideis torosa]
MLGNVPFQATVPHPSKIEKYGEITDIRDVRHGAKGLFHIFCIVLDVGHPMITKDGNEVRLCKVADKTGSISAGLWNEKGKYLEPGNIIHMTKVYAQFYKNSLTLYLTKAGSIIKVGDFTMLFSELPFLSEPNAEAAAAAQQAAQANADQRGSAMGGGHGARRGTGGGGRPLNQGDMKHSGSHQHRGKEKGAFKRSAMEMSGGGSSMHHSGKQGRSRERPQRDPFFSVPKDKGKSGEGKPFPQMMPGDPRQQGNRS